MKRFRIMAIIAVVAMLLASESAAKKQVIRAPGGTSISPIGLIIDASHDPRLDGLVPGYKIIDVAVANQSFEILYFDPEHDKWQIKLVGATKPITAVHDLRRADPKAWAAVPERARNLLSYPLVLPVGAQEVIDIFVPESVDVQKFNELDVYLRSVQMRLEILVRQ
jgi:hypothetical protein